MRHQIFHNRHMLVVVGLGQSVCLGVRTREVLWPASDICLAQRLLVLIAAAAACY